MGIKLEHLSQNNSSIEKGKSASSNSSIFSWLNTDISFSSNLSSKVKYQFYKDLGLLLAAGIDLRTALELSLEAIKKQKVRTVFEGINQSLINGLTFSESLNQSNKFSEYEYYSLKIGEESGSISDVIEDLADFYQGRLEFKQKLINTFSYPVIVLLTAGLAVIFMLTFIVPIFEDAFKRFGGDIPYLTQKVLQFSDLVQQYGGMVFLLIMLVVATLWSQRKKDWFRNHWTAFILKVPFLGNIAQKTYLSRFCHSMGLLIQVNNPLNDSIALVRKMVGFYPLEQALDGIEQKILEGNSLHFAMSAYSIFPKRMISLIKVAEEVNKLGAVFEQIKLQYEAEIENKSKVISSLLEPFLIIFIGIFVGVILIAMYLPLFELGSGIQ